MLSQSLLPLPCSFPPAMPIKTELDEPSALSPLHHFESMDEIIERQNQRSRREHHSKCKCDTSPSTLSYSPTRSSLHTLGYSHATAAMHDLGCAKAIDDSLPSDVALSQVSHIHTWSLPLASSSCVHRFWTSSPHTILNRIHNHNPPNPVKWAAITGIVFSIEPSLIDPVALLVV
jgi:hypothetical protein